MYSRSVRVLLVEDSPSDVWLLKEAFRLAKFPVQATVAHDGVQASDYLREVEAGIKICPDLIVLDLNLPRKNGRELLAEIRHCPALRSIPIVMLSSSDSEDDKRQAYQLHASYFLTKPNSLPDYVEMVKKMERFWLSSFDLRKTA